MIRNLAMTRGRGGLMMRAPLGRITVPDWIPLRKKGGNRETPVVILGTGGSGTRAIVSLAQAAGYFMGTDLNRAEDSRDVGKFIGRWPNRYLRRSGWIDAMWGESSRGRFPYPKGMREDFEAAIGEHRAAIEGPDDRWGWKAPRTILILPFVHQVFPRARIVHLVRDGRDMAYSSNQTQMRRHGAKVLPPSEKRLPRAHESIMFWSRVNLAAARYGEGFLGDSYLRLRYEDVCADPGEAAIRLVDFLDCPVSRDSMREAAAAAIQPSTSTGRWREREPGKIRAVERLGGEALREFGYL
jgi:hypothetical protein